MFESYLTEDAIGPGGGMPSGISGGISMTDTVPYSTITWLRSKVLTIPFNYLYNAGLTPEDIVRIKTETTLTYAEANEYANKIIMAEKLMQGGTFVSTGDSSGIKTETLLYIMMGLIVLVVIVVLLR